EERSIGDAAAAAELYERVIALDPEHDDALAARARILLSRGDVEGALALLVLRRERAPEDQRAGIDLEIASLLLTRVDRPGEALARVAPHLEGAAPGGEALSLTQRALARAVEKGDTDALKEAAQLLARAADSAREPEVRAALFDVLLSIPPSIPELRETRRGWFERLLEAPGLPSGEALDVALRAVAELPTDLSLWERAE